MAFNSIEFLLFCIVVFVTYWLLQGKKLLFQNLLILAASYVFYAWWDWRFLSLIIFSTFVDYFLAKRIHSSIQEKRRKLLLYLSLTVNLGLLGVFKYFNFFVDSAIGLFNSFGLQIDAWSLNIILPVGISFYTFQTMSYTIDVYKNKVKPTSDFVGFAAFVCFFPQLVAGPIERASNLIPQFINKRHFSFQNATQGLSLIVYGLFKKIVVADRLAIYVNNVYSDIPSANSISLILAAVFFSFQIYCDFSGYSLIARGVSKLLGFELMQNFDRPYLSKNIAEFWRRWHISLSTWFRDYLYIPLGGSKKGNYKTYRNIALVFLVSGLWHGASWNFIIWGGIHAILQLLYLVNKNSKKSSVRDSQPLFMRWLSVFSIFILVTIAWVFFRSDSLSQATEYFNQLFQFDFTYNLSQICGFKGPLNLILSLVVIALLLVTYILPNDLNFNKTKHHFIFTYILMLIIVIIGVNGESEFIYFQF